MLGDEGAVTHGRAALWSPYRRLPRALIVLLCVNFRRNPKAFPVFTVQLEPIATLLIAPP